MSLRQPIKLIRYISGLSDAGLKPSLETSLGQVAISCEAISTFYAEDVIEGRVFVESIPGTSANIQTEDLIPQEIFYFFSITSPQSSSSTSVAEADLNFNILSLLSLHESGSKLVQKYGNPEIPVNDKDGNKIINIALGHAVKAIGNYYPKSSTMEKLAEAIVKAFPQMGLTRARLPSHAYIYNSATKNAFLVQHLKRMRNAALSDNHSSDSHCENTRNNYKLVFVLKENTDLEKFVEE
ncbi:hypothetical protein DAPPUDRAFT_332918 [Daphnia pulex]|uniref:Uncharacterized protein n=1 Tax=Daphnia pulex TaxID=6669 RepID=E9HRB6_DAPPU|nr:hypothetical protein DAPPUDRAFT_332918 [Daphnia pulex]|eukprot:EFX65724.1 hypothetical protein DAPPUDRAFT_332918 [Daphnia pulex]